MNRIDASYPYVRKSMCRNGIGGSNSWGLTKIFAPRDRRWANALLAGAFLLLVPGFAAAQGNPVRPRITERIDEGRLTVLQGNTHPLARPQFDQGAAPPNLPMDRMILVLKRSAEQQSALTDLLEQQQDKSSPNFHKWLTPDQFGQQFGPADQDIQAVTSWLTSRGFQSVKVSKGRTVVEFSGTAAQVESVLHTAIHKYTVNAEDRWANVNDPQIPAALAPVVSGILSLHNFPKKPLSVRSGRKGTVTVRPGARPQILLSDNTHGVVPADFDKIYNINPSTMTGAGTTIGVIARTNINVSDVSQFRSLFGLPTKNPVVIVNGPDPGIPPDFTDPNQFGEELEAVLDATWPGAVAPSATVDLVVSEDTNSTQGVDLSEMYIIDNNLADVMTESFSNCEADPFFSPPQLMGNGIPNASLTIELLAEQAAAQGITYLVASGDGGPDSCDDASTLPTNPRTSVNILASTPFTVAVGGTALNEHGNDSTYWDTNGNAIKYIPEDVWNDSCTVATCPGNPPLTPGLWSSGGGQSSFFAKPSWQSGVTGISSSATGRLVPDVSVAAADHDGYVLCVTGSCAASPAGFDVVSGTSASAQAFGGIMALVVQAKGRQGQANYVFYKLAASETLASCNASNVPPAVAPASNCIFNDVTSGNTTIPGGNAGFTAGVGYDETTGLGSVNVTNLISQWNTAVTHPSKTTLTLNGGTTAVNITHGQSVSVGITAAGNPAVSGKTPVGDVALIASSTTGQLTMQGADGFPLDANSTFTGPTTLLPGSPIVGGHPVPYNVTAHYAGDGTFLGSDSNAVSVTVIGEPSKTVANIIVTPSGATTTSFAYGSPYVLAINVSNSAGAQCNSNAVGGPACPTGTVTVTDNGAQLDQGTFNLNSLAFFEDQPIQLPVGPHSIVAVYLGDNSFIGSTSAADVVTVTKAATVATVVANPNSVAAGAAVSLTATVTTTSNGAAPTGNVKFFSDGAPIPGGLVPVTGSIGSTTVPAQATASISPVLVNGTHQITVQYLLGDSNYAASAVSAAVTVSVGVPGINATSSTGAITISAPGQSGTQLVTVSAANGFTGKVTLSCAVTSSPSGAVYPPTCSFGTPALNFAAPNTITLSSTNTSGNATLTVATTPVHAALFRLEHRPGSPNWFLVSEVGAAMACIFLMGIAAQKRRSFVFLAMVLFAVIAVGAGCGSSYGNGGGGGGGSNPGTTLGAYTVTVTATPAGGTAQTTTIAVTVN